MKRDEERKRDKKREGLRESPREEGRGLCGALGGGRLGTLIRRTEEGRTEGIKSE